MRGSDLLRRIPALASIFLVMTMTAGCWDAIDIDKRAFVSVMGLDSADSDEGGRIQVTLIVPTLGGEGGGGAGGGGGGAGTPETMPAGRWYWSKVEPMWRKLWRKCARWSEACWTCPRCSM